MTPTDYQKLKKLVFALPDYSKRMTRAVSNTLIQNACADAFEELPDEDKRHVYDAVKTLRANCDQMGEKAALELIAALGDYLNHNGNGGKG